MGVGQVRAVLQEGNGQAEGEGEEQSHEAMRSKIWPFWKYSQVIKTQPKLTQQKVA